MIKAITIKMKANDETQEYKPIVQDAIVHHPEGVDLIPSNLELSSMETRTVSSAGGVH